MFSEYVNVLECLAGEKAGMTTRAIARKGMMEYHRVANVLKKLEAEKMVRFETKSHRPNVIKKIWYINEKASEYCAVVATTYSENF